MSDPASPPPRSSGIGAVFGAVERLMLFLLSSSVGILNLLIGVALAAHLGIIPRKTADAFIKQVKEKAAAVGRVIGVGPKAQPDPAVPPKKGKPKKT